LQPGPTLGKIAALRLVNLSPLLLLGLAACGPGRQAVYCTTPSATCLAVNRHLEEARENVGGWCGTPYMTAAMQLAELGPPAAVYLALALSDRDEEIAWTASIALADLGEDARITRWCQQHPSHPNTRSVCRSPHRGQDPGS
jgi:hypothetical protein